MATMRATCLSARFLSEDERVLIADRVRAGVSLRAIGRELERPASTVSREVSHNRDEVGRYRPSAAHRMALRRLVRPKERRLARDPVLRDKVQGWLDLRWSPEQSAHTLRADYPDNTAWHLVHESIYQAIYARDGTLDGIASPVCGPEDDAGGHTGSRTGEGLAACVEMTMLGERPAEVEDRAVPGRRAT